MNTNNLKLGEYVVFKGKPYIVKDISRLDKDAEIVLEDLFTGEITITSFLDQMQETEIQRRCATIISKNQKELELIDVINFKTIHAKISSDLLEQASENDQVTYLQFDNTAKVIEVRKQ